MFRKLFTLKVQHSRLAFHIAQISVSVKEDIAFSAVSC